MSGITAWLMGKRVVDAVGVPKASESVLAAHLLSVVERDMVPCWLEGREMALPSTRIAQPVVARLSSAMLLSASA